MKIIVVGGGITGLSAAWELSDRADVTLLEASATLGGKLTTATLETAFGVSVVDGSAESFVTRKEDAYQLLLELGLQDSILEPEADTSGVYLLRDRRIQPVPTSPLALLGSKLLSLRGKLRLLSEPFTRSAAPSGDESLHGFLKRRVGVEAAEIFGPVMAGIYSADPRKQSVLASFGVLRELERDQGSLVRGMLKRRSASTKPARGKSRKAPRAVSLRGGVRTLVDALEMRLLERGVTIQTSAAVTRVQAGRVTLRDGTTHAADAVILALPAPSAAQLLERDAADCATALRALLHAGIGTVALVFPSAALEKLRHLRGVMIPHGEGREIDALLMTGFKMPERTPSGTGLLRVFFGANRPELLRLEDEALLVAVRRELRELFGIDAAPLAHKIFRWHDFPILGIGHLERVAALEATLPAGVFVAGASYRGIGVPDCVRQGREAARRALEWSERPMLEVIA